MLKTESPVFENMFCLPHQVQAEGDKDTAPIRLSQVEVLDFERLLELLYPLCVYSVLAKLADIWSGEMQELCQICHRDKVLGGARVDLNPTPCMHVGDGKYS